MRSYVDGTKPERTVKTVSGTCGRDLTWTLEDGTLTVSGTGEMDNYMVVTEEGFVTGTTAPWEEMLIDTVIIEEGVTSVGDYAFASCYNLMYITIPDSITNILSQFNSGEKLNAFLSSLIAPEKTEVRILVGAYVG